MGTYGSVASGRRILDDDVAKGVLRQGVVPTIARVNPTRSTRRIVTGDAENVRRIIGKSELYAVHLEDVDKAYNPMAALKGFGGRAQTAVRGFGQRAQGAWGGAKAGFAGIKPSAILPSSRTGVGAGAVGQAVNQGEQIGIQAQRGWQGLKKRPGLQAAGVGGLAFGGGLGTANAFGKRSYDPENERRFRQGAAATATGGAGLALLTSGGRTIRTDTKALRAVRETERPMATSERPTRPRNQATRRGTPLTPQQAAMADARHARDTHNWHAANQGGRLADKARVLPKGALVTRRAGAKAAGGAGLLGVSGALFRNRSEERWD